MHAAVRAEHVAVIGGEDDDRVVAETRKLETPVNVHDVLIDRRLQEVIEAPVHLDLELRQEHLSVLLDVARLRGRLRREIFVLGRRRRRQKAALGIREAEQRVEDDVVRIDERIHDQPRLLGLAPVECVEKRDRFVAVTRITHPAGVRRIRSVRLGTDPAAEAVVVEAVGRAVVLDVADAVLPMPSVCDTPCSVGYWPVKKDVRLGAHAVDCA